jgi:hypothetical protein
VAKCYIKCHLRGAIRHDLAKMKHTIKPRSLVRSLMSLFGTGKAVNAHKLYPDVYYRHIYFTKPLFDGIEFLAITERKSKKQMAHELMELGISHFMGEKIREYNKRVIAARELEQEVEVTRFIRLLRRWARSKGYDISKFI